MLSPGKDAIGHITYERHRPEQTLLYQLIEKHYPALIEQLDAQGKSLPLYVHQEFEGYLKCGRLEHGFLRVRCDGSDKLNHPDRGNLPPNIKQPPCSIQRRH